MIRDTRYDSGGALSLCDVGVKPPPSPFISKKSKSEREREREREREGEEIWEAVDLDLYSLFRGG